MNDIALELAKLHILTGADFIRQLKLIVAHREFHPIEGEDNIYSVGGETGGDYANLLNAARKAVEHGFQVYVLPNPKGFRTADLIFLRKGVVRMYDLKTISGMSSVDNRLKDSIGQSNRILLNLITDYNPMALARSIRRYFEKNPGAIEVLIYKGRKSISVLREDAVNRAFFKIFIAKYIN